MRIAMLLPVADRPMTRAYALWTRSARDVSEALVQRGVEMTAVPVEDAGPDMPTYRSGVHGVDAGLRVAHLFQRADDFDLIHDMLGFPTLSYSALVTTPVLATVWFEMWSYASSMYEQLDHRVFYMAPGDADRRSDLHYTATLPWGVPTTGVPMHETADEHLVFTGPLRDKGGVLEAMDVARRANRPLALVGRVQDPVFFEREVAPHVRDGFVRHHDDPASPEADRLIGQAAAMVHVGTGVGMRQLALLDAMARGTPVVAICEECSPTFVREGETGLRCDNVHGAVAAVERVGKLDRNACRASVVKSRSLDSMIAPLMAIYDAVIAKTRREDHRPWGYYVVLADEPSHKVKRLVIHPGKRVSLQRHRHRSEHWYLIDGEALVVQDDEEIRVMPGQSIEIPKGCWHRIRNPGSQNLTVIEIQTGDYFGEDDIERREDDFGRV